MASEPKDGSSHDKLRTVTIRTFSSHDAANIARSNLEAHGIKCWINADDCGGWYTNLTAPGGVRLFVHASDAEAALALLNTEASAAEINQIETDAMTAVPPKSAPLNKLAWLQILAGCVIGVILCLLYQELSKFGTTIYYHHVNGKVDKEWMYRNGHEVEFAEDRNLDGIMDHWVHDDAYGHVSRSEYDNNFDGKPDETWVYSNDTLVSMQKDTDFNGTPDVYCTYKYGIIQQADIRPNGSKFAITRELFQNGVLTDILRGGDRDGNFKEDEHYDPFLNRVPANFNSISTNAPKALQFLFPTFK
jgi:hypothetical protein